MKTMFFAAAAAFLVLGGAAQAEPVAPEHSGRSGAGRRSGGQAQADATGREPAREGEPHGSSGIRNATGWAHDQRTSAGLRMGGLKLSVGKAAWGA